MRAIQKPQRMASTAQHQKRDFIQFSRIRFAGASISAAHLSKQVAVQEDCDSHEAHGMAQATTPILDSTEAALRCQSAVNPEALSATVWTAFTGGLPRGATSKVRM